MSKVISDELFQRVLCILETYIDEETMAEGYGGGSENPHFKEAKDILEELYREQMESRTTRSVTDE